MIAPPRLRCRNVARRPRCSTGWSGLKTTTELIRTPPSACGTRSLRYLPHSEVANPTDASVRACRSPLVQLQRGGVDAITEPGRGRAVREDVPEVAAARRAQHLGAHHAVTCVGLLLHGLLARRRGERGPAAAGVVLCIRVEQLRAAAGAAVGARLEDMVVLPAERRLGALLAQDAVLLGRQLRAPLLLSLLDVCHAPSVPGAGCSRTGQARSCCGRRGRAAATREAARRRAAPARRGGPSRRGVRSPPAAGAPR